MDADLIGNVLIKCVIVIPILIIIFDMIVIGKPPKPKQRLTTHQQLMILDRMRSLYRLMDKSKTIQNKTILYHLDDEIKDITVKFDLPTGLIKDLEEMRDVISLRYGV